jgi:hypothetical protein
MNPTKKKHAQSAYVRGPLPRTFVGYCSARGRCRCSPDRSGWECDCWCSGPTPHCDDCGELLRDPDTGRFPKREVMAS